MRLLLTILVAVTFPSSVFAGDAGQPVDYLELAVVSYQADEFTTEDLFDQHDFVLEQIEYEPQEMEKIAVDFSDISFSRSIDQ